MEKILLSSSSNSEGQVVGQWNLVDKIKRTITRKQSVEKKKTTPEKELSFATEFSSSPKTVWTARKSGSFKIKDCAKPVQSCNSQKDFNETRITFKKPSSKKRSVSLNSGQNNGPKINTETSRSSPRHSWSNDRWNRHRRDGILSPNGEVFFEETKLIDGLLTTTLCSTDL